MKDLEDETGGSNRYFPISASKRRYPKSFKDSDKARVRQLSNGTICLEHPPEIQVITTEQDGVFLPTPYPW